MCSSAGHTTCLVRGSPIRTSSDQRSVGSSPRLLAASHVLHRLLVPRHPPCALNNLTTQKPHPHPPILHPKAENPVRPGGPIPHSLQSQKMLASTVQFSTYDQPPLPRPRQTPPLPQEAWTVREPERPCQKDHGRPLPQDPTACLRPTRPTHRAPRATPKGRHRTSGGRTEP